MRKRWTTRWSKTPAQLAAELRSDILKRIEIGNMQLLSSGIVFYIELLAYRGKEFRNAFASELNERNIYTKVSKNNITKEVTIKIFLLPSDWNIATQLSWEMKFPCELNKQYINYV